MWGGHRFSLRCSVFLFVLCDSLHGPVLQDLYFGQGCLTGCDEDWSRILDDGLDGIDIEGLDDLGARTTFMCIQTLCLGCGLEHCSLGFVAPSIWTWLGRS
jgi:hypothetical protein